MSHTGEAAEREIQDANTSDVRGDGVVPSVTAVRE